VKGVSPRTAAVPESLIYDSRSGRWIVTFSNRTFLTTRPPVVLTEDDLDDTMDTPSPAISTFAVLIVVVLTIAAFARLWFLV
jgi:hypothetical protein